MGKYALLLAFASALGLAYFAQQSNQTSQDTSQDQAQRQETVIARQIARSAFNDGVSEVQREFSGVTDKSTSGTYEQGEYRLEYSVSNAGTENKSVLITAEGTYDETTYRIQGRAQQRSQVSSLFNGITASGLVTFQVKGGGCSGGPCVSGVDAGGGETRHGITLPNSADTDQVCDEFDNEVEGIEDGCDVVSRSEKRDDWVEKKMGELEDEILSAKENGSSKIVECDGCSLDKMEEDSGILYVTGELTFNGDRTWKGIVYVDSFGSIRINGGGGERNINGGLLMEGATEYDDDEDFDMRGGNRVKYNTENIKEYIDVLPSIESKSVQIADRSGGVVRSE